MGTLDTPSRDDRPDELLSPADELPKEAAGQNVERSTTDDLAKAVEEYRPPGPDDVDIDFESFDPKHPRGTLLLIGETGSRDDPKRFAHEGTGDKLWDVPPTDEPLSDNPTGQDVMKPGDSKTRFGRLFDKSLEPETVEGTKDAASTVGKTVQGLFEDVKPTGAYVGTPERPVATSQQNSSVDIGMIGVGAPLAIAVAVSEGVRKIRSKLDALIKARGETPDAGD